MKKGQIIILICVILSIGAGIILFEWFLNQSNTTDQSTEELQNIVREKIRDFKLKKLIQRRDLILRKENFSQVSQYQEYVTPENKEVLSYISSNTINNPKKAYTTAINWIWVSDQLLHGIEEKWLKPAVFLQATSSLPTNPVPGNIASDCESQAYTLVSILEAIGVSYENVRVVVGEVDFYGEVGGHAWVQIYQNNDWVELEATSGSVWDEDDNVLLENIGFPYTYFKNHPYPVKEYWAFFNDVLFYNPNNHKQSENLPAHWLKVT